MHPNHYLVVDHAHRAVVLSICGTSNTADLLTDLMASTVPFLSYKYVAHEGIAASARNVLLRIEADLRAALAEHPTYKLVLTGHSLGGGTAILATYLLLVDPTFATWVPDRLVECYAFAPPPVLSTAHVPEARGADGREAIRIFVYKDDWICALSYASAYRLAQQLARIERLPLTRAQRLTIAVAGDPKAVPDGAAAAEEFLAHTDEPHPDLPTLYHPGQVYWLRDQGEVARVAREATVECLRELRVTPTMATDHLQPCYERALEAACRARAPDPLPTAVAVAA